MTYWTIIPFLNRWDLTEKAAIDASKQTGADSAKVLIIAQGVSDEDRQSLEMFCERNSWARAWFHDPPLPSLSATWNRGLEFVWGQGENVALVCNNDVELTPDTFDVLHRVMKQESALLVTATGVEGEEGLFEEAKEIGQDQLAWNADGRVNKGGPGFSCFLISKAGHEKYPFDEALTPAYCEDLMLHRMMMLQGDGDRIFGTNVRYLHLGGQTLLAMSPERREATQRAISSGSRAHYAAVWGGGVNEERWVIPYNADNPEFAQNIPDWVNGRIAREESVTTMALFDELRKRW